MDISQVKLKYGLKGFSFINMLLTSVYALSDYLGQTHGDFSQLAADGIGYEYTVPLTLFGTAAVSTYIYRSEKKRKLPVKEYAKSHFSVVANPEIKYRNMSQRM